MRSNFFANLEAPVVSGRIFARVVPVACALALAACTPDQNLEGDKSGDTATDCSAPTAGIDPADISITLGQTALISGSGTGCAGRTVSPNWTVASVPIESEIDSSMLNISDPWAPYVVPDVVGTYVVSLIAIDDLGATSVETYAVINVTSGNSAPIADCGENLSATEGDRVDLDGTGSSDPDDSSLALVYDWTLSSAPSCSALDPEDIFNGTSPTASVVPDCDGVFVVSLLVSDGENWSTPDYCAITVAPDNQAPIADAGDSTVLSPCTNEQYQLNGFGSYDPEGEDLTFSWSLLSYPAEVVDPSVLTFSDSTVADPYFQWTEPGEYTFMLQVNDGVQDSSPDIVTYTFADEGQNSRPIANAGDDQTISATPDCSTSSYTFTCEDCPSDTVTMDGTASSDPVDGDELDFMWTEPTGEVGITAPYSPTTDVSIPAFASTYNTAVTKSWELTLAVSDCTESDDDHVTITYTCTGEYSP